jgi:hypothetical protein
VAAPAERRRQRGSKAAMAGSAVTALAAQDGGGRDEDNSRDSDGRVHSRQSTKRGSGRDDSGGGGDGGGNSDSDGNGDGDSKDKDSNADVKGFFGWHRRLFSARVVRFFGVSTIMDNWVSPWLSRHPFSQYSPTGSTRSDAQG